MRNEWSKLQKRTSGCLPQLEIFDVSKANLEVGEAFLEVSEKSSQDHKAQGLRLNTMSIKKIPMGIRRCLCSHFPVNISSSTVLCYPYFIVPIL